MNTCPLAAQIHLEWIWTLEECPKGALQGWSASKRQARAHQAQSVVLI